jgi:hypothetical protein
VKVRPIVVYVRDAVLFLTGVAIAMNETGVYPFSRPSGGPSTMALLFAGLLCNGPVVLQALGIRFGTGSHTVPPEQSPQGQSSESSSLGT